MAGASVVGVDFGTLSGRARRGARRATARSSARPSTSTRTAVIERELPATGERLPRRVGAAGPRGLASRSLRTAVPAGARGRRASTPRDVVGIATDFTASTPLPDARRRHAAVRARRASATRPHAYAKLWKHHAAQAQADRINALAAERGEPWLARYGGRISSEWEFAKALQVLEEDPEVYDAHGPLGRGRRLDRLAAVRRRDAQRLHRRLQGDPPGRPLPVARTTSRRSTQRFAGLRRRQARGPALAALGARAGGADRRRPPAWTGLPEGIAVAVGNVDAHVTAPAAQGDRARARCSRSWAPRPAT